jgi:hypothetical protein
MAANLLAFIQSLQNAIGDDCSSCELTDKEINSDHPTMIATPVVCVENFTVQSAFNTIMKEKYEMHQKQRLRTLKQIEVWTRLQTIPFDFVNAKYSQIKTADKITEQITRWQRDLEVENALIAHYKTLLPEATTPENEQEKKVEEEKGGEEVTRMETSGLEESREPELV